MTIRRFLSKNSQCLVGFIAGLMTASLLLSTSPPGRGGHGRKQREAEHIHSSATIAAAMKPRREEQEGWQRKAVVPCPADDDGPPLTGELRFQDLQEHRDDPTVAKQLARGVRVLVMVMTEPRSLHTKAAHVRNTWGKRANKLLFMSSQHDHKFPTVGLDVPEGRDHLTAKTMKGFRFLYQHHLHDADWFMKADDDTYVIMENLRYLLSAYNTEDAVYFGKVFNIATKQGYASGGAGYVLSKEALRRLATKGYGSPLCHQDGGSEDAELGICLNKLGVKLLPSTDRLGRSRFHCFSLEFTVRGRFPPWYSVFDTAGSTASVVNISDYPITFHYTKPKLMYAMEYLVYHLRLYGIVSGTQHLNRNGTARQLT